MEVQPQQQTQNVNSQEKTAIQNKKQTLNQNEEENHHDSEEERDQVPNDLQQKQQQQQIINRSDQRRMTMARRSQTDFNLAKLQRAILEKTRQNKEEKKQKILLAKNFFVHGKKLRFAEYSYFIFSTKNSFRNAIVWLQEWKWFDRFITFCILLNTVILMLQDYKFRLDPENQESNWRNSLINFSEYLFSIIFLLEFMIKSIGMGFIFEKGTYLRDGWNILDFIVVCSSIISFFPDTINLSAVRTLRILRPLRSINSVKGMKVLVTTLIDSLPALGNVVIFLLFVMILFAILSLQLFSGVFENRCRMTEFPVNGKWEADESILRLCNLDDSSSCPDDRWCGSPYQEGIQFDSSELDYEDFNYGYTKFDNLFQALFSIFQSLTTEGWTNIVFLLTNTYTPIIVYLYFIFLVLIGSFFIVNLILAVVNEAFVSNKDKISQPNNEDQEKEQQLQEIEKQNEHQKKDDDDDNNLNSSIKNPSQKYNSNSGSECVSQEQSQLNKNSHNQLQKIQQQTKRETDKKKEFEKDYYNTDVKEQNSPSADIKNQSISELIQEQSETTQNQAINLTEVQNNEVNPIQDDNYINREELAELRITPKSSSRVQKRQRKNNNTQIQLKNNFSSQFSSNNNSQHYQSSQNSQSNKTKKTLNNLNNKDLEAEIDQVQDISDTPEGQIEKQEQEKEQEQEKNLESSKIFIDTIQEQKSEDFPAQSEKKLCKVIIKEFRQKVAIFIEDPFFIFITTLLIIANTVTLALDKYPSNKTYSSNLETANLIFTYCFVVEMVIKMFGLGVIGYLRDSFNIFDGTIVILSLVEIILSQSDSDVSGGGFAAISAFRSLRLFRIFKLARSWVSLKQLLMAMGQTLSQISNFSILVLLFMVVASLLGIEFFAYKIRFNEDGSVAEKLSEGESPRVNYDTFLQGIIATFVLLTNEDWNAVLYNHMKGMDSWLPSVYFIIVVVIGNFILLQLFLAILIYNFQEAQIETKEKIEQEQLSKRQNLKSKENSTSFSNIKSKLKNLFGINKMNNSDQSKNNNSNVNNSCVKSPNSRYNKNCYSIHNSSQQFQRQEYQFVENCEQNGAQTTIGQTIQSRTNSNAQPLTTNHISDMNYKSQKKLLNSPEPTPRVNKQILRQSSAIENSLNTSIVVNNNQKNLHNGNLANSEKNPALLNNNIYNKNTESNQKITNQNKNININDIKRLETDTYGQYNDTNNDDISNKKQNNVQYPHIPGMQILENNDYDYDKDQINGDNFNNDNNDNDDQNNNKTYNQQYNIDKSTSLFISGQFETKNRQNKYFLSHNSQFRSQLIGSNQEFPGNNNNSSGNIKVINSQQFGQRRPLIGKSLFVLGQNNMLRQLMYYTSGQNWFEWTVIGLIIFSSIILVLDSPLQDPKSIFKQILNYADMVITLLFVGEALIKIIAYGLIFNGKHSYLRNLSNCLDFSIVVFSLIGVFYASDNGLDKIKVLRILRVLRPLRLISKNEDLKLAINSLILSIPQMFNLLLVCLIFYILFGIFGVNYFKGTFFYCNIEGFDQEDIITKQDCFDYGGDWVNQAFNFDNLLQGMITLFVLSTTEGWVSMMWHGVDAEGIDTNPQRDSNLVWSIFYILFILVGGFFVMNLFAGIVVESFSTEKNKLAGITKLNESQQKWVEIGNRILEVKPQKQISKGSLQSSSKFRTTLYKIATNRLFDPFILACIILNTVVFMLVYHRQSEIFLDLITTINIVFLVIFTVECIIKIIAFKQYYFYDSWNVFDFVVVVLTLIGVLLEYLEVIQNIGSATSIIRTFRIARVLKLIKRAKSLRMMFATFMLTLPALANIGTLLFLVLFLFSILGMNLFSYVKPTDDGITNSSNFSGFFNSFFTLFKCSTGESWNLVLRDIVQSQEPNNACVSISSYDDYQEYGLNGCGSWVGYLFLVTFQIMFSMIVLNLFVAVILEGFDKITKDEESTLKPYQIQEYVEEWLRFDPSGSGFIPCKHFRQFMENIEMGFKNNYQITNQFEKNIKIGHLHLQVYVPKAPQPYIPSFNFQETLISLSKAQLVDFYIKKQKQQKSSDEFIDNEQINIDLFSNDPEKPILALTKIEKKIGNNYKKIKNYLPIDYTSSDYVGFEYINRQFKLFQARKKEEQEEQQQQQLEQDSQNNPVKIIANPLIQNEQKLIQQNNVTTEQQNQESEIIQVDQNQFKEENQQKQENEDIQQKLKLEEESKNKQLKYNKNLQINPNHVQNLQEIISYNPSINKPYLGQQKLEKFSLEKKRSTSNNSEKQKKFDLGFLNSGSKVSNPNSKNNLLNSSKYSTNSIASKKNSISISKKNKNKNNNNIHIAYNLDDNNDTKNTNASKPGTNNKRNQQK